MNINRSMVPREFFSHNPTKVNPTFGEIENRAALDVEAVDAWVGDSADKLRQLDKSLSEGHIPKGLESLTNRGIVSQMKRHVTFAKKLPSAISGTFIGGALGVYFLAAPLGPIGLVGAAAAGAAVGYLHTRSKVKQFTGEVQVELSGQTLNKTFHVYPHIYERTAPEVRHLLTHQGTLGDSIEPVALPPIPKADPTILKQMRPFAAELRSLGRERRLVADLGARSRYGKPALSLVDANLARKLMAAGDSFPGRVYVVNGQETNTESHTQTVRGESYAGNSSVDDEYRYETTDFSYRLKELTQPSDLGTPDKGIGLPAAMAGLYRDDSHISLVTKRDSKEHFQGLERVGFLDGELDLHTFRAEQLDQEKLALS